MPVIVVSAGHNGSSTAAVMPEYRNAKCSRSAEPIAASGEGNSARHGLVKFRALERLFRVSIATDQCHSSRVRVTPSSLTVADATAVPASLNSTADEPLCVNLFLLSAVSQSSFAP